jgi:hypothetical protein
VASGNRNRGRRGDGGRIHWAACCGGKGRSCARRSGPSQEDWFDALCSIAFPRVGEDGDSWWDIDFVVENCQQSPCNPIERDRTIAVAFGEDLRLVATLPGHTSEPVIPHATFEELTAAVLDAIDG